MSHLLCSTTSFKSSSRPLLTFRPLVWLFFLAAAGCTEPIQTGSTTLSSVGTACSGDGGLFPTPVAPQAVRAIAWKKFAVPQSLFSTNSGVSSKQSDDVLPARSSLIAIVDEICVLNQSLDTEVISYKLLPQITRQQAPISERAYAYATQSAYTRSKLTQIVQADPCLLHLSEDTPVTKSAEANDPRYSEQLHLDAIRAPVAWDTFYSGPASEVTIAIIDDGIELTHDDLSDILWVNPDETAGNGIDDDGNGYVDDVYGYNFASSLASPAHQNGSTHGTHVAGLAAAQGNNNLGVTGVIGQNARIMALNVFGASASSSSATIVNAINYARTKGAQVINLSLGGQGTSAAVNTALINAVVAGSFIAIAAGNSDDLVTATNFYMPMGYAKDIDGAVAVGSIDATTLLRSSFSNYSTTYVELAAPGSNSATGGLLSTFPTNTYSYSQGTSMSSPVVAGAAALLISWMNSLERTISPAQVESLLRSSADSSGSLLPFFAGGASLNLENLVASALCNF